MQAENLPELTDAVLTQAETIAQQANLELHFMVEGDPWPLPPLAHRKILFIIREALNNVQRHAQATIVELSVAWAPDALEITLIDNGAGFSPQIDPEYGHFGLSFMALRAQEIQAELSVTSSPGHGTHVHLRYRLN
jgi:two-component system nitrate/nitrite sensor histidine kinase NarX